MTGHVKVGGAWKDVDSIGVKVGGAWKSVDKGFTKVGGAWKEFYTSFVPGYELITTTNLSAATASVTFNNLTTLAAGYSHLQLRLAVRGTSSGQACLRMNGITTNSYSFHQLRGNGFSNGSVGFANQNFIELQGYNSDIAQFRAIKIDLLDFNNTTKNSTIKYWMGYSAPGIVIGSGALHNTAAINSIEIYANFQSFDVGSRFSLYGRP